MSDNKTIPAKLDKDNPNWNEYSALPGSWLYQRIEQLYSLTGCMSCDNPEKGIIRDIYNVISRQPPMEETKPVYTKEMHERGEKPTIGAKLKYPSGEGVIVVNKPDESGVIIVLDSHYKEYKRVALSAIEPIPTIEDELFDITSKFIGREMTQADLVYKLLDRFNITPKGE